MVWTSSSSQNPFYQLSKAESVSLIEVEIRQLRLAVASQPVTIGPLLSVGEGLDRGSQYRLVILRVVK